MLTGIHMILTYMCNFECDHCFLYCSPDTQGTFTLNQVKQVFEELSKIGTIETIGFEGGEPFLYYALMLESIKLAHKKGFKTAIETNSYWATTEEDAELWLKPLYKARLSILEVSDDAFHHGEEHVTPAKYAAAAAQNLGIPVNSICIDQPTVKEATDQAKGEPIYVGGPKLRGRAVEKLIEGLPKQSWEKHTECPFEDLRNPQRVHLDVYGNVHLCQGLSMGNMWETPLSELLKNYDADTHPICGPLLRGGPAQLAKEHHIPHEDEYVDPCHFCSKICLALIGTFPQYLAPRQVYGLEQK